MPTNEQSNDRTNFTRAVREFMANIHYDELSHYASGGTRPDQNIYTTTPDTIEQGSSGQWVNVPSDIVSVDIPARPLMESILDLQKIVKELQEKNIELEQKYETLLREIIVLNNNTRIM
jgi:hypothetical protein